MKNLLTRSLTGALFVALIIGAVYAGPSFFIGLFSVFTVVGVWEFYRIAGITKPKSSIIRTGIYLSAYAFIIISFIAVKLLPVKILLTLPPLLFLAFTLELYRKSDSPLTNIALLTAPLFYIAIPFGLLSFLYITPDTKPHFLLMSFFFFIWANDTFAYLTGISIGKHRLFERISPKKSWEGFIGGIFFTALLAFIISFYSEILTRPQWITTAIIISISGTFGDLIESMLKRSAGVKDSGKIMPGHGGILDRFDGVIAAAPFVVLYLYFIL